MTHSTVIFPAQLPSDSPRFRLWKHLHDEHRLTLLESELDEIVRLACATQVGPQGCVTLTREQLRNSVLIQREKVTALMRPATPGGPTHVGALQALADAVFDSHQT